MHLQLLLMQHSFSIAAALFLGLQHFSPKQSFKLVNSPEYQTDLSPHGA